MNNYNMNKPCDTRIQDGYEEYVCGQFVCGMYGAPLDGIGCCSCRARRAHAAPSGHASRTPKGYKSGLQIIWRCRTIALRIRIEMEPGLARMACNRLRPHVAP